MDGLISSNPRIDGLGTLLLCASPVIGVLTSPAARQCLTTEASKYPKIAAITAVFGVVVGALLKLSKPSEGSDSGSDNSNPLKDLLPYGFMAVCLGVSSRVATPYVSRMGSVAKVVAQNAIGIAPYAIVSGALSYCVTLSVKQIFTP